MVYDVSKDKLDTTERLILDTVDELATIGVSVVGKGNTVNSVAKVLLNMKRMCFTEGVVESAIIPRMPKARKENYSAKIFKLIAGFVEVLKLDYMDIDKMKKYGIDTGGQAKLAKAETLTRVMSDCVGVLTVVMRDSKISDDDVISCVEDLCQQRKTGL